MYMFTYSTVIADYWVACDNLKSDKVSTTRQYASNIQLFTFVFLTFGNIYTEQFWLLWLLLYFIHHRFRSSKIILKNFKCADSVKGINALISSE